MISGKKLKMSVQQVCMETRTESRVVTMGGVSDKWKTEAELLTKYPKEEVENIMATARPMIHPTRKVRVWEDLSE